MTRHDFFVNELSKLLLLHKDEVDEFLKRFTPYIRKEQAKRANLTKTLIARGLVLILKDIRNQRQKNIHTKVLSKVKHHCLKKHWSKFLELKKIGYGAKRIEKYFNDVLHCKISHVTLQNALNLLKDSHDG